MSEAVREGAAAVEQHAVAEVPTIVVTRYIFLEKPTTLADVAPFVAVFFIYGLVIQIMLAFWKRLHPRTHSVFQLVAVLGFPPLTLMLVDDRVFFCVWLFFLAVMLFYLKKVIMGSMTSEMPRQVYAAFRTLFLASNAFIVIGQLLTVLAFMLAPQQVFKTICVLLYSLYIAVMAREVVLNLSQIMAVKTGFFSKDGLPAVRENLAACMICTGSLENASHITTLHCGHNFHSDCIRGWCIIGQNRFCPYCKHGVDSSFFAQDTFDKVDMPFKPLMNFLRSGITLFIIIYCIFTWKTRN
ncbi:RING finger protein 121/175 [Pancytospora philotis]|nr:RING finger protein 121/175 [Pancytospora philotis]